jgi:predicted house-cleaning noncanonical NTP pyrophosphatase (MazG superfamily)
MDIRLAQKIAWENKRAKGINEDDIPLEFYSLKDEVADALIAWREGRGEVSQELADIAIFLLRLAQMVGTDLEEAVEARLASNTEAGSGRPPQETTGGSVVVTGSAIAQGKLVRDKIPQIIRSKGEEPMLHTASLEEYEIRLRDKLREEVEEFLASDNDPEELADILEVLHALAGQAGTDQQQLETLRANKAEQRGGFAGRIVWSGNRPSTAPQAASTSAPARESMGLQTRLHRRRPATAG